jgi:ATP-dependent Clp endopeptidase proteolytic subunit ClpP
MFKLSTHNHVDKLKMDSDDDSSSVETSGSRIFFYSDVSKESILSLNRQLRDLSVKLADVGQQYEIPAPPIKLHINSPGGSLFDCLAAVDYIKNSKVQVHSVIEGSAASAATIISVVAHKRYMYRNSYMLIHQLSTGMWGKYEEMVDDFQNATALMSRINEIYKAHTKIPANVLKEILKRDIWFDSKTCLKYGLVDQIIGE